MGTKNKTYGKQEFIIREIREIRGKTFTQRSESDGLQAKGHERQKKAFLQNEPK
jgi:hypothetical protein